MSSTKRSATTVAKPHSKGALWAWLQAALAAACALTGLAIALHYPLAQPLPAGVFALCAALAFVRPASWLVLLPALLPVIGFAPWTGWITFEEFDLLVLAVAAGGYARLAWPSRRGATTASSGLPRRSSATALIWLVIGMFAVSVGVSMARGFADAGGFSFGWFQGYREPMNSLRLAKPFFAALLLFPLWQAARRDAPEQSADGLSLGLMLGLLGASLATVWERIAFPDLLNFSTDYRTTALFWEMQVGGAALDGFLALTVPFAVRELLVAPSKRRWVFAAAVCALAAYACLTTFSRGVYLAVPAGLLVMYAIHSVQQRRLAPIGTSTLRDSALPRLGLIGGFVLAAAWMFPSSGYRGVAAVIGALLVLLPMAAVLRHSAVADRVAGVSLGIVLSLIAAAGAWLLPKGPYVVHAVGVVFSLAMLALQRSSNRSVRRFAAPGALAGYVWVLTATALVALHWGGEAALWRALPVLAALLVAAVVATVAKQGAWPRDLRWQGNTLCALVATGGLVASFGGGAYMGERFASTSGDFAGRMQHWQLSLSMLKGVDALMLGKGLGRYVESYAIAAPENLRTGDYRLRVEGDNSYLGLVASGRLTDDPKAPVTYGNEMLRFSQRVQLPSGTPRASLDVRVPAPVRLYLAMCTKHLIYRGNCMGGFVEIKPKGDLWQRVQVPFSGNAVSRGDWYAPALVVFFMGTETPNAQVDVDNVVFSGADGNNLLSNGEFTAGTAHWFFTSDRDHLPWHAKNIALHVMFDQGLVGLVLLGLLGAGALWRVSLGNARTHPLAPSLAGALFGFACVGLFDSLLDVPRVAFIFYGLLLVALTLPARRREPDVGRVGHGIDDELQSAGLTQRAAFQPQSAAPGADARAATARR